MSRKDLACFIYDMIAWWLLMESVYWVLRLGLDHPGAVAWLAYSQELIAVYAFLRIYLYFRRRIIK